MLHSDRFVRFVFLLALVSSLAGHVAMAQVPPGFERIFNGENLEGWHISRTTHQGTTPDVRVEDGAIVLRQNPYGQGGVLLSDRKYKDFELYVEAKIDAFSNGGIFLRSSESGIAYQVELDETAGSTGSLLGERMPVSNSVKALGRSAVWKPNDWNSFRVRMVGEVPHLTLWINGVKMWEVRQPKNDFVAGATEGMIGFQSHWTALFSPNAFDWNGLESWAPGATHRFRNIAIKELSGEPVD
ncbi:3-keto-disaccharide hydrolase [Pontibacter sp. CAU 1760]